MDAAADQRRALQLRPCAVIGPDRHPPPPIRAHADIIPRPQPPQAPPPSAAPPHYPSPYSDPHTHQEPLKPHYEPAERYDPTYQVNPYNVEYPDYTGRYQTAPATMIHNPPERVPYEYPAVTYSRLPGARYEPYPQIKHTRYDYQYPYTQYPPQPYPDLRKRVKPQSDVQFYQVPHHPQSFYQAAKPPQNIIDQKYVYHHARPKQYVQTVPYDPNVAQDPNKAKLDYYNRCRAAYPNVHYPAENYHVPNYTAPNYNYGVRSPNVHYQNVYYHKPVEYHRPVDKSYELEMANQKYYNAAKYASVGNPLARIPTEFSPNVISPAESSGSFDSAVAAGSYQLLQEDGGYVSQCSTISRQSAEYQPSAKKEYYNQSCSRPCQSASGLDTLSPKIVVKQQQPADKPPALDLRQFLQIWDEEYEDPKLPNTEVNIAESGNALAQQPVTKHIPEQLYVLDKTIITEDELKKYEHLQKVTKLPDFIKDVVPTCSNGTGQRDVKYQFPPKMEMKQDKLNPQNVMSNQNKPIMRAPQPELFTNELIDVESKISQSVIHKEVGCNFEIKPCSPPKMLNAAIPPEQNKQKSVNNFKNMDMSTENVTYKNYHVQYSTRAVHPGYISSKEACNVTGKIEKTKNIPQEGLSKTSLPIIHSDDILVGAPISYKNQIIHYSTPSTITTAYREPVYNYSSANAHGKVNVIMNPSYVAPKNSQKEKYIPHQNATQTPNYGQMTYDNSYMNEYKNRNGDNTFTQHKYENNEYYSKISKVSNANFPKCSLSIEKSNETFYSGNENPLLRSGSQWVPKSNEKANILQYESIKSDRNDKITPVNNVTVMPMINPSDIKKIDLNTTNCRTVICRNKTNINNRDGYHAELNPQYPNYNNSPQRLNQDHAYKNFNHSKVEIENLKRCNETLKNDAYSLNIPERYIAPISSDMQFDNMHQVTREFANPISNINHSVDSIHSMSVLNMNHAREMAPKTRIEDLDMGLKSSIIIRPISPKIGEQNFTTSENKMEIAKYSLKDIQPVVSNGNPPNNEDIVISSPISGEQSKFTELDLLKENIENISKTSKTLTKDLNIQNNNSVIVKSNEKFLHLGNDEVNVSNLNLLTSVSNKKDNLNEFVQNYLEEVKEDAPNKLPNISAESDEDLKCYVNSADVVMTPEDNNIMEPVSESIDQFQHSETDKPNTSINSLNENGAASTTVDFSNSFENDVCEIFTNDTTSDSSIVHNKCEEQTNDEESKIVRLDKNELQYNLVSTASPDNVSKDDSNQHVENENEDICDIEPLNDIPDQCIIANIPSINGSTEENNENDVENIDKIDENVTTIAIEECLDENVVFDEFGAGIYAIPSNKSDLASSESIDNLSPISESQGDVIQDDIICEGDECDEIAFKADNCNILLKSVSMDEQETYVSFEGDRVDYFSADFDDDSRYVIIRTDEHLSYAAADSSENDFACDEHISEVTEESPLSPSEIREKLSSEDGNGLEMGGCWIDDIACVETVIAEESVQDSTECYKSPEDFWNGHTNDEDTNSPINYDQDSDDDVIKDSNSNVITNYKMQMIDNSNDSTKYEMDSSYDEVRKDVSSRDSSSTRTSEESTEQNYKINHLKVKSRRHKSYSSERKDYVKKEYSRKRSSSDGSKSCNIPKKYSSSNDERDKFINNQIKTKGAQKYIPSTDIGDLDLKCQLPLPENKLLSLSKLIPKSESNVISENRRNRMVLPKKPPKPKFEDVLRNIDEVNMSWIKMKLKKSKKAIPKVIIKRNEQGSHYTSTSRQKNVKPPAIKNKWQPQVCLRRNNSIENMVKPK